MSEDWVGSRVTLDCGKLGYFQGIIKSVNIEEQTLNLDKPFQNGVACKFPSITLNASDIQDLKILGESTTVKQVEGGSSVVQVQRKKPRPVAENLTKLKVQDDHSRRVSKPQPLMSQNVPLHIQQSIHRQSPKNNYQHNHRASPKKNYDDYNHRSRTFSESCGSRTPNGRGNALTQRQRDEDCFGSPFLGDGEEEVDVEEEFDFEKNLALFDKQTVFSAIDQELGNKPDIVRLVDCNRRAPEPKYRNDENVLESAPAEYRQISTGEVEVGEFVTDSGLVVPAVSVKLRERLNAVIANHGLGLDKQCEVMARAATELSIHLIGGQHRLAPTNMHQVPVAVILSGPSQSGVFALSAARHLAGHGVKTQVYLPELGHYPHLLEQELRLYRLTGGKVVNKTKDLPKGAVDLVIAALEDQEMWQQERQQPWHRAASSWISGCPAPVLALDPPPYAPTFPVKMTLVSGLPLPHPPEAGKLYLANLGIPKNIYKEVGIKFNSPFGAKFVISLHPRKDE